MCEAGASRLLRPSGAVRGLAAKERHAGTGGSFWLWSSLLCGGGAVCTHVHFALDAGTVFHDERRCADGAVDDAGLVDDDLTCRCHLSVDGTAEHELAHIERAVDDGVGADDECAVGRDLAGECTVDAHCALKVELSLERRLLRAPWTAMRSNQSIKEINPEYPLEGLMLKLKLQQFGHPV